ncbi:MAG TPA: RES family NAD+ phosphorylase, partial [Longimicrobiaceae bacterium]|nr:RES family NAD+ phosphorylase [Longimicrobiaceae bacterium]
MLAWRVSKARFEPFDGTGAMLHGARWNSPGRPVVYAADSLAGAILEILAHALRPRTLPGPHHAVRIEVPDALVETLDPGAL